MKKHHDINMAVSIVRSLNLITVFAAVFLFLVTRSAQAVLVPELALNADSLSLSDGDPVSLWGDTSGNSRDAVQGTTAYQPTFQTGELNGLPVVRFASLLGGSVANAMDVDFTTTLSQPFTVFVVTKINGNAGIGSAVDVVYDSKTGANRVSAATNITGGNENVFAVNTSSGGFISAPWTRSQWQQWHIYEGFYDSAGLKLYIDGVLKAAGAPGGNGITAADDLRIGNYANYAYGLNGDIASFLIYSGTPTLTERSAIGYNLASKYNLIGAYDFVPVPEPSIMLLLGMGGLLLWRRQKVSVKCD